MAEDSIRAPVTYMVRGPEKPYVHTPALTGGAPRYFADMDPAEVTIRNARPLIPELSVDRQGFELHQYPTAVKDLHDDNEVRERYYPEVEALLRDTLGARRVLIFDHTRRSDISDEPGGGYREAALRVHNDYTEASGPQRLRDILGAEVPAVAYAQVNVWRPIRGPVLRSPLALLDASSLAPADLLATDQVYPDRVGEIYHVARNPAHRWYYFPHMTRDEVILIKGYDSRDDGRARFTPHTAFADPESPAEAPPRESIEIRAFVLFG